ncbi:unnamed protein product, partial [Mesorhabditis spiculigera]
MEFALAQKFHDSKELRNIILIMKNEDVVRLSRSRLQALACNGTAMNNHFSQLLDCTDPIENEIVAECTPSHSPSQNLTELREDPELFCEWMIKFTTCSYEKLGNRCDSERGVFDLARLHVLYNTRLVAALEMLADLVRNPNPWADCITLWQEKMYALVFANFPKDQIGLYGPAPGL